MVRISGGHMETYADWPGRKYRWGNQTGSIGGAMKTGVFWEEGNPFLAVQPRPTKEATCDLPRCERY